MLLNKQTGKKIKLPNKVELLTANTDYGMAYCFQMTYGDFCTWLETKDIKTHQQAMTDILIFEGVATNEVTMP